MATLPPGVFPAEGVVLTQECDSKNCYIRVSYTVDSKNYVNVAKMRRDLDNYREGNKITVFYYTNNPNMIYSVGFV